MFSAIGKLRGTGGEPGMFARWAETMAEQKSLSLARIIHRIRRA
jgi:hypothetical protein